MRPLNELLKDKRVANRDTDAIAAAAEDVVEIKDETPALAAAATLTDTADEMWEDAGNVF